MDSIETSTSTLDSSEVRICTLFSSTYATRGITMLQELQRISALPLNITVLALDDLTEDLLRDERFQDWNVLTIHDLKDEQFYVLRDIRPFREFCWTAASVLVHFLMTDLSDSRPLLYVDSDCYFFRDVSEVMDSWDSKSNILIHEHRYSPDRTSWESSAGRFNVGVVGFRPSIEAISCTSRWRAQTILECVLDPDRGLCGDQGYLNEWPDRYEGLQIMTSVGMGAAPWNVTQYKGQREPSGIRLDGESLVFYHFHAMKMHKVKRLPLMVIEAAYGYEIGADLRQWVYRPYLRKLRESARIARRGGLSWAAIGVTEIGISNALHEMFRGKKIAMWIR